MTTNISIAICTRDRSALLRGCLNSLQPQMDAHSELLVVDSAPSSGETRALATAAGVSYITTPRPGLNVARNLALRAAQGPVIAFIDDDALAAPNWIGALRESFADPSIACVTGRVLPLELRTPAQRHFEEHFSFDRGPDPLRFTLTDDRPWFPVYPYHLGTGCNMAFRREVFDTIGGFDEALDAGTYIGGGGDIDAFRRLLRAGFAAAYNPQALVYHQHRVTSAESRRQFWDYGKTFTALLAKSLLIEHDMMREALLLSAYRFWQQGRWLVRRLLRGKGLPISLILIETLGHLVGPVAYLRALRRVQRDRLHHLQPAQVQSIELDDGLPAMLKVDKNHDLYLVVNQKGLPRETLLMENPGPAVARERLARRIRTVPGPATSIQPLRSVSPQQVSIVIPTRNRPALLSNCLQSLSELQGVPYEIIVVDNASGPETAQTAVEYPVRLVREEQLGLSRARNRGLAEAHGDIVAFLDDDVVVDPRWLTSLAVAFGDPAVACVVGLVLPLELRTPAQRLFEDTGGLGRGFERRVYHKSLPATPQADIAVGANMAFRREVLLTHSPFSEALDVGTPAHAGGDIDMFYRLLRAGETILYEPAMLVWHRHRETLSSLRLSRYCYSVGAAAAFSRWALGGDLRAVWLGLRWFGRQHIRELVTSLLGLHRLPPEIIIAGQIGAVLGPLALMRACWQIRHRAPVEIRPQGRFDGWHEAWEVTPMPMRRLVEPHDTK